MSMVSQLQAYITRVGTEFKAIRTLISGSGTGDVSGLNTTATDLVGAVNEVKTTADAGAALIDDGTPSASKVWSSNKTNAEISAAVAATVDAAPGALDTLNELAAAIGDDANYAATVTASLAAKANSADIGPNFDTHDFVADFNAAIA